MSYETVREILKRGGANPYLPRLEDALADGLSWGDSSDEGFIQAHVLALEVKRLMGAA